MSVWAALKELNDLAAPQARRTAWWAGGLAAACGVVSAAMPLLLARVFTALAQPGTSPALWSGLGLWLGLTIVSASVIAVRDTLGARVSARLCFGLRQQIMEVGLTSRDDPKRLVAVVEWISSAVGRAMPGMATSTTVTVVGFIAAWLVNWRVGVLVSIAAVPVAWLYRSQSERARVTNEDYTRASEQLAEEEDRFLTAEARDAVVELGAEDTAVERFTALARALIPTEVARYRLNYTPRTEIMGALMCVATVLVAVLFHGVSFGDEVGALMLTTQQINSMLTVVLWGQQLQELASKVGVLVAAFHGPAEAPGGSTLAEADGRLDFRAATVVTSQGQPVLRGVNLSVAPGEVVALVGPSGAGKTSIARAATANGRLTVVDGEVLLDGVSIADLDRGWLRRVVQVASQSTHVFAGLSVYDQFMAPEATEADVREMCEIVGLDGEIREWGGYGTKVGGDFRKLSGGQRQRLGTARALLRVRLGSARLVILDEATAALPPGDAQGLMTRVFGYLRAAGVAVIVITHQLELCKAVDRVAVVAAGAIVEHGTLAEVEASGAYRMLLAPDPGAPPA